MSIRRILTLIAALSALALLSACETDTEGTKPSRQSASGDLPWNRPASWEGGLPGMTTNNMPNQY